MIEKGNNIDKINFIFKQREEAQPLQHIGIEELRERFNKYQAFCVYSLPDSTNNIIDTTDFTKDTKKKKPIKAPEFNMDMKTAKLYQKNSEHNILIYDKTAEFIVRNKILEESIRIYNHELETKAIFKQFNELYEDVMESMQIYDFIQYYSYTVNDFLVSDNTN
jgi:hypothetical protein